MVADASATLEGRNGLLQPRIPRHQQDLLELVAELLGEAPEEIEPTENLVETGIDSVTVMRIVDAWTRGGLAIKFAELFERPTVADWWRLVAERTPEHASKPPAAPVGNAAPVDEAAPFELSPIQHAYWVGRGDDQVLGGVGCRVYLEIDGTDVDPDRLHAAVRAVAARHPMLRVRVHADGTQQIMTETDWPGLTVHDLRFSGDSAPATPAAATRGANELTTHDDDVHATGDRVPGDGELRAPGDGDAHIPDDTAALTALRARLSARKLDAERGEVFDVQLSLRPGGATRLHIELDLLVADVLSFNIFLDDLAAAYRGMDLPALGYSFPRYRAELAALRAGEVAADRAYWQDRLADLPAAPALPLAVEPEQIGVPRFERIARWLPPVAYERLGARAAEHRVTVAMMLATAFCEVLGRWSNTSRMLLNVPVFDRKHLHSDVPEMIADFTNLVLLDVDLSAPAFVERVRRTQRQFQSDISHTAYSGLDVLRDLTRHGDGHGGAPVVFAANLNSGDLLGREFRDAFGELGFMLSQTPQVWLDHQLMEMDGGLYLNWDYVPELFDEGVVEAMFDAYCAVLEWLSEGDWSSPPPVELPASQQVVRAVVGATERAESGAVLHGAFFAHAAQAPDRPALLWLEGALSYGELAQWALRIAGGLVAAGVQPGDLVAVTLPKGPSQVAAILGVLAAGAAYVPSGIDQPAARRERMFAAAGVRHVVAEGAWPADVRVISPAEPGGEPLAEIVETVSAATAYVIFTSGSTGQPKGVEVSHRAAVNTVEDINARFGVGPDDRALAVSAADFDLSVYDMFGLLGAGGALVLVDEADRREAPRWVELCARLAVTVWNTVPALFDMYLTAAEAAATPDRIRLVLVSGDWVGLDLPGRYYARCPRGRFVALGGATEAAIWSNAFEVARVEPEWRSIPYGFALRNQCYRVVDTAGRDCPDWVAGELWIGGVGVAQGYRGDAVKTADKFVHRQGGRWYRTGDLGRFWPDGTLEFLGRADHQVKVRGHRIELGEIEAALEAHPAVTHAVAGTVGAGLHRKLAAAVVTDTGADLDAWLRERLPAHMVPERFALLAALPLTPNGKVDRKAVAAVLAEVDAADTGAVEPPQGPVEELLAELWAELLNVAAPSRTDNFFRAGGDSLIGTRMVARLGQAGVAGAQLRGLFASPTLAGFAATLTLGAQSGGMQADPAQRHAPFPVTEVQRAYLLGRRPEFTLGGIGCAYYAEFDCAELDLERFTAAWQTLVERHDMLRAVFRDNEHQQVLETVPPLHIPVRDGGDVAQMRELMSHHTFEPSQWPLFDVQGVRTGDRVRIGITLDNLIVDALSIFLLFDELDRLYTDPAAPLRPVGVTFRDYEMNNRPSAEQVAAAQEYWLGRLDELPPAPELPLAIDPGRIETPRFGRAETAIGRADWDRIGARARECELTPSAVLLAAYAEVLGAWCTRQDLTLVLTTFQRNALHPDVDNIIGEFTSLLLVAYQPERGAGLAANARRLQEQMWLGLDHHAAPATWVMRELARRAGVAEMSMPVVFTSALGVVEGIEAVSDGAYGELVYSITQTPQVQLDLQVREYADSVSVSWDFVEGLFPDGLVEQMFDAYCAALEWLAQTDWQQDLPVRLPRRELPPVTRVESGRALHTGMFDWAARAPQRPALVGEHGETSFGALAESALCIAGGLVAAGVHPGDVVGVTLPKGPVQLAAIYGVLAAGAAYVPIGVDQPVGRRTRMFAAAGVRVVLADTASGWPGDVRVVDPAQPGGRPLDAPVPVRPQDPAYVIFTSGSTGQPKGVQVPHRAALNTIEAVNERFGVGAEDRALALSAADFDLSVYDVFGLPGVGGALVLIGEEDRKEAPRWVALAARFGVTVWNSVPALFDMYLTAAEGSSDDIRLVLLAGDWVGLDLPDRYHARNPQGRFVALAGPTETAIWSNAFEVDAVDPQWRSIPFGFPLPNVEFRLVDALGRDCPDWVAGELWIGGAGVADGYRGDPDKTADKFVDYDGRRWYRSGDLGRFWPDGTLEFLGRADHQVKVRGHRIELGEIEAALEAHPLVERAVAATVGSGAHRAVAAALTVAHRGGEPATDGMAGLASVLDVRADRPAQPVDIELEAALVESRIAVLLADGLVAELSPADEIAERLGVVEEFRNLVRLWLDWLADRDVLARDGVRFAPGPRWTAVCAPTVWDANVIAAQGTLLASVAQRLLVAAPEYTEILRGDRSALTLLEDPVLAPEALVTGQPDVRAALARIARTVAGIATQLGRPVRVAEWGCRTGMAAELLLTELRREQVDLTLLETSQRLLDLCAQRLDHLPHTTTGRVLVNGVVPDDLRNSFDVVISVVALHRYRDTVTGALEAAELLVPRGLLIGVEHAELAPIGLLTAAVLERGFGAARRSPMLDRQRWTQVLTAADFDDVSVTWASAPTGGGAASTAPGIGSVAPAAERPDDSVLLLLSGRTAADRPVVAVADVQAAVRTELPAHMVPERLVVLPRLPLSARDKVDRGRVAELLAAAGGDTQAGEPPQTETEQAVADIWGELLSTAEIGRHTNFFALGGDSLTATNFAEVVRRRFGVILRLRQMFAEPTVAAVADLIAAQLDDSMEEFTL